MEDNNDYVYDDYVSPTFHYYDHLSVQNALPEVIFTQVFKTFSPGFLWVVCRPVCRAWKESIESLINQSTPSRVLLQVWSEKEELDHITDLMLVTTKSFIYRSTLDSTHHQVTFRPLQSLELQPQCPVIAKVGLVDDWSKRRFDWSVVNFISSIFPGVKRGPIWDTPPRKSLIRGDARTITFFNKPMTPKMIDNSDYVLEYRRRPPLEPESFTHVVSLTKGRPPIFSSPVVKCRLQIGEYHMECRYLTDIVWDPNPLPTWNLIRRHYRVTISLSIDEIIVPLSTLLHWRCGCPTPCSMDKLIDWSCPALYPKTDRRYRRGPFTHYTEDRNYWTAQMNSLGPAIMSPTLPFVKEVDSTDDRVVCTECHNLPAATWITESWRTGVNTASMRCPGTICGTCCAVQGCMGHHLCAGCRSKGHGRFHLECTRVFHGLHCVERPHGLAALDLFA
jgi:hypothetical protein